MILFDQVQNANLNLDQPSALVKFVEGRRCNLNIRYNDTKKDLPCEQLRHLFMLAGWSDGNETPEQRENFNMGFVNSRLVISAWDGEHLVGAVRVLSDRIFRSVIYDLIVDTEYQGIGIGKALMKQCLEHFPTSEWLVQTTTDISGFYEKNGFKMNHEAFLSMPCLLFTIVPKSDSVDENVLPKP